VLSIPHRTQSQKTLWASLKPRRYDKAIGLTTQKDKKGKEKSGVNNPLKKKGSILKSQITRKNKTKIK